MTNDTFSRLDAMFLKSPILRASTVPSESEIAAAARRIGVRFHQDYVQFLSRYGGAMVGPYPIFGLRPVETMGDDRWSVVALTQDYRSQGIPSADAWVIFSEDHGGNPIGMDDAGTIWIHDHDLGGTAPLASGFEAYIRNHCLKLK